MDEKVQFVISENKWDENFEEVSRDEPWTYELSGSKSSAL